MHIKTSLTLPDATTKQHLTSCQLPLPSCQLPLPAAAASTLALGAANECGEGPGEGFTVNVPWQCGGMGNGDYVAAFQHILLPIAMEFNPDLIIASAGELAWPA